MIRTQVYFPDDIHRDLMHEAKVKGVPYSHILRESAVQFLKRQKRTKGKQLPFSHLAGALTYGPKDLSVHINDIYR